MVSPAKKLPPSRDASESTPALTVVPTPFLDETRHYRRSIFSAYVDAAWMEETPTLMLPIVGIDQLPTYVGLRAIPKPIPSPTPLMDGVSIYEQPTWILPVIRDLNSQPDSVHTQKGSTEGEGYLSLIRNLVKSSGLYAISSVASPLISLVLTPLLTRMLSRTDYGALAVLSTAISLAAGVTGLGLGSAFTRMYAYDCKTKQEQADSLSTLILLLLLVLVPFVLFGVVLAPWLSEFVLGNTSYGDAMRIAVVLVFLQNLTAPGLGWMRVEDRAGWYSIISIFNLIVTAGATVILVGIVHMGLNGSLIATGIGNAIMIVCTLPFLLRWAGFHLRWNMAWSMLVFGVPNVTNVISNWVLQLSDRYLLEHLTSLSLTAGYSVAYSLGGVLSAAIIFPFSLAWWVIMYPIAKRKDAKQVFKLIFRWFSLVLLFAAFGLSFFGTSALNLLFPSSYHSDSPIIPVITLSIIFSGIFVVVSLGTSLQRKTWLTSLYFIIAALVNIGCNFVLIPIYGAMGAAISTLIAYVILALIAYGINQWMYPVPFEVGMFTMMLFVGILLYLGSNYITQGQGEILTWSIQLGFLVFYGISLTLCGWLRKYM
jgi:O-antigen/teichoic acid export membrane protein